MADLQKFLKERQEKKEKSNNYDSDIYPFWQMDTGESAIVRILPEIDESNPFPFIEKLEHKLSVNGKTRKMPCPSMYGNPCPICDLSRQYYDTKDEDNGKYYYRDSVHLCKALILSDPLPVNVSTGENFEGKVATLQLGYQIMEKIIEQLTTFFDPDDEVCPWDMQEGFNFIIKKTKQGKDYPKYDIGSTFERRSSPIPAKYLKSIELVSLESLLPAEPEFDKVNAFLDSHLSGTEEEEEDSLAAKRKKGANKTSSSRSALARLELEEEEESEEQSNDSDLDSDTESEENDEDDEDMAALLQKIRRDKANK